MEIGSTHLNAERGKYITAVVIYGTIGLLLRCVHIPSETAALFRGLIGSVFFLHESMHPEGWAGACLILGAALVSEIL